MTRGRRSNTQRWNDKVTNELFLWKKLAEEERPAGNGQSTEGQEEPSLWLSKAFSGFLESLERFERPSMLDLGPVTNRNISFYGELGWKVYAYDILQEYEEAVEEARANPPEETEEDDSPPNPIEGILNQLKYEPGSLHGVLCWDVLDRLPMIWTRELIRRISLALNEGGVILSFFGVKCESGSRAHRGFRIRDESHLEPIFDKGLKLECYRYENGEIMSLFSDFRVLNFYMMKNNFREIFVQKHPQASLKVSV